MQWIIPFWYFRNCYKQIPSSTSDLCCDVTRLWVVLRTTGCWRTSILTQKVDSPWTKIKTTVPSWNSGCRVGRNWCLVLLLLLCAGRIQFNIWLHHCPNRINLLTGNTYTLIRNCLSKPFYNKKRREFSNWPFNEIVKGFDEQRSAFIIDERHHLSTKIAFLRL